MTDSWKSYHEKYFTYYKKENKFIGKIFDETALVTRKIVKIPSEEYPLNRPTMKVFHSENCNEITDKDVLECFDKVEYRVGCCYTMAEELALSLKEKGYEPQIYAGWLFMMQLLPVFHCWVVLNGNVLDLQDDYDAFFDSITQNQNTKNAIYESVNSKTYDEMKNALVEFKRNCDENKIPNSKRCQAVGIPSQCAYYVGSRINNVNEARALYNYLMQSMPNHDNNRFKIGELSDVQKAINNNKT